MVKTSKVGITENEINETISFDLRLDPNILPRLSIKTLTTFLKIKNNNNKMRIKFILTSPINNKT